MVMSRQQHQVGSGCDDKKRVQSHTVDRVRLHLSYVRRQLQYCTASYIYPVLRSHDADVGQDGCQQLQYSVL